MLLQYKSQSQLQVLRHNIYSLQFYVAASITQFILIINLVSALDAMEGLIED